LQQTTTSSRADGIVDHLKQQLAAHGSNAERPK
jgi:hypothetical protein